MVTRDIYAVYNYCSKNPSKAVLFVDTSGNN